VTGPHEVDTAQLRARYPDVFDRPASARLATPVTILAAFAILVYGLVDLDFVRESQATFDIESGCDATGDVVFEPSGRGPPSVHARPDHEHRADQQKPHQANACVPTPVHISLSLLGFETRARGVRAPESLQLFCS